MNKSKSPTFNELHNWKNLDKNYQEECKKYNGIAIPSREFICEVLAKIKIPVAADELAAIFKLNEKEEKILFHRLKAMRRDGELKANKNNGQFIFKVTKKYLIKQGEKNMENKNTEIDTKNNNKSVKKAILLSQPENYAWLKFFDNSEQGFVGENFQLGAMHNDVVLVEQLSNKFAANYHSQSRKEESQAENYRVIEILERKTPRLVGKLVVEDDGDFLLPINRQINYLFRITDSANIEFDRKSLLLAEITKYPTESEDGEVRLLEVLDEEHTAGIESILAIENHAIPTDFSPETLLEVADLPENPSEIDYQNRLDLRALPFVTIDGIDSRDFDDAVYAEKTADGYRLFVAIADVSHYVRPNSALDKDAAIRSTSVYFPKRVVPMLPEKLSNGLCSLNPDCDRLTMSAIMDISPTGEITKYEFAETVIHSAARLTYQAVEELVFTKTNAELEAQFARVLPSLSVLKEIFALRTKLRTSRGSIDFDIPEAEFIYDSEGKIKEIHCKARLNSHRLIEECMLAANTCAAEFVAKANIPVLYRIHDKPQELKINDLRKFLNKTLGRNLQIPKDFQKAAAFAEVMEKTKNRPEFQVIAKMMLMSLEKAVYSNKNHGHFALALDNYAHFTSPIRRYPDLLLHRAIRFILQNGSRENYFYNDKKMLELATQTTLAEIRADTASREAVEYLKCEYLSNQLGEEFTGTITSITHFGIFVELNELFISGLVHISRIFPSDYYYFKPETMTLFGEKTRTTYKIGDSVKVIVAAVNKQERKVDFEMTRRDGQPAVRGSGR